jgi:hypothetical protein
MRESTKRDSFKIFSLKMKPKLKIISACDEKMMNLSDLSFFSVVNFCKKHNFDCERFAIESFDRPPSWFKIKLLIHQLQNTDYDYIMWIDADACINNYEFDISSILCHEKSFFVAKDLNDFNLGVFIIKNNQFAKSILFKIYSMTEYLNHIWWEQAAFIDLYKQNYNSIQEQVSIIEQKTLNAYDYRYYGYDEKHSGHYNKDSFVVHFPSLDPSLRYNLIQNIIQK